MDNFISLSALLDFLAHAGTGLFLILIGLIAFALTTRFSEMKLISQGNVAVALKLWGKAIGLAIIIYTVWSNSVSLLDAFIWGLVGIVVQVVVYLVIEIILRPSINVEKKVEEGNTAIGFSLFSLAIVVGIVVAASLTY
ncbi:DUF350 domain-containing protein [Bacillus massiliigorillae]|uniref:DUF350 domain-containing protein n=1 Tax=Bacillus massiliigorillae TaxID=1243664 RepID=UPI0003A9B89F|nr:DUF350 domain-containing protein [Bacillus massiliigorillae]